MDSSAASETEKKAHLPGAVVNVSDVDVAARLASTTETPLDPEVARRLKRKIDMHLMPLMCLMYLMTFADKTTLGQSAVLGIIKDTHLTALGFNWLGTIFYLSYLAFEYPQNLALQYFPVGKWLSVNIFVWAVALLAHAACKSFGGLFAVRFILGMCEGAITPGFMIVTSMFYTREEQTRRVGYWFTMNGVAIIFLGLVSFGLLHTHNPNFHPWQWLMIITGLITLVTSVIFWFFFPDSPTTAWFLTPEERVLAVQRIKVNQAGVENKHWKREQFIETLRDPKTWLLALLSGIANVFNSLTNQRQIIVNQFGYTAGQTTLLGTVDGAVASLVLWAGVALASVKGVGRGYACAILFIPAVLGSILVNALPSHNKIGLLFSYWVSIFCISPYAVMVGWAASLTAGHTKRTTTNAIFLIFYGVGNAAGPQMWEKKYQPRNHVPWAVVTACCVASGILALALRFYLANENKKRDAEPHVDTYDNVYLTEVQDDGTHIEKKVDRAFLDLTDRQNKEFRYIL